MRDNVTFAFLFIRAGPCLTCHTELTASLDIE
jgi:hypothetical protein